MSFDISRKTFDAWNDYFGVVMQQGRVQMDSDWNEWIAELARRLQAGTLDILGVTGVPSTTPSGFRITVDSSTPPQTTIGYGRIYVDGILAENHLPKGSDQWDPALAEWSGSPQSGVDVNHQPWLTAGPFPTQNGPYLFYLDVWQREVTYLEDPCLVDKAVGIDTTGRYQTVWQVKFLDVSGVTGVSCSNPGDPWTNQIQPSAGLLTTGIGGAAAAIPGPCSLSAAAGYTGLENQLYRVEIHEPTGPTATATFKWSRNNAIVTTRVTAISGSVLSVQSLGKDQMLAFMPGNWIEIINDSLELNGQPGNLCQIDSIDSTANTITLVSPPGIALSDPDTLHTRITRWDQAGTVYQSDGTVYADLNAVSSTGIAVGSTGIPVPASGTTLILENGITVAFDLETPGGPLRTGDFWIFAARTADGSVETLTKAPSFGIYHHYCRLSIVDFRPQPPLLPIVSDCRQVFPSLANPAIHVKGVLVGGSPLPNGGTTTLASLDSGITVVCDLPLDPAVVTQPTQTQPTQTQSTQPSPICFLTVDIPGAATPPEWFTPVVLSAVVGVAGNTITWIPSSAASTALINLPPGPPLLARLTLKGSGIRAANNPNIFLNGVADGRPYADFGMWFWLVSQPLVSWSPGVLGFGEQQVSTPSEPQTITVINNPLNETLAIAITGGDFNQTNTTSVAATAPDTIPPGATCTISVTFKPTTLIGSGGQIIITGSADGTVPTISLTGTGVPAPELTGAAPASLGFGSQPINTQSTPMSVTLTGNLQLAVTGIALLRVDNGAPDGDFTCDPPPGSGMTLQNDQGTNQGTVTVWFNPTTTGPLNANLQITHNAGSPLVIPLSGSGAEDIPKLQASTTSLRFTPLQVTNHQVVLTNIGSGQLAIDPIPAVPNFTVINTYSGPLGPNESCTITFNCSFDGPGGDSTVSISYHPAGSPLTISLSASNSKGVFP